MKAMIALFFLCLSGCSVSLGFFAERNFHTYSHEPDVKGKIQIEFKREFGRDVSRYN